MIQLLVALILYSLPTDDMKPKVSHVHTSQSKGKNKQITQHSISKLLNPQTIEFINTCTWMSTYYRDGIDLYVTKHMIFELFIPKCDINEISF